MPISTWIRDIFGIRKDLIDTKKSTLEVKKLEQEEERARNLITPATLDDVKRYDPKYRDYAKGFKKKKKLKKKKKRKKTRRGDLIARRASLLNFWPFWLIVILILLALLLYRALR